MTVGVAILASPLFAGFVIISCQDTTLVTGLPSSPSTPHTHATLSTNIVWTLTSLNETGSPVITIANPDRFTLMLTDEGEGPDARRLQSRIRAIHDRRPDAISRTVGGDKRLLRQRAG